VTSGLTHFGPVIFRPPRFRASVDLIKPFLGFLHIRNVDKFIRGLLSE